MEAEEVYVVRTDDGFGEKLITIGYAQGREEDIRAYFEDRAVYNTLDLSKIEVVQVTPEAVEERKRLQEEKADLKRRLKGVKEGLRV